jgi:hypothetical protein
MSKTEKYKTLTSPIDDACIHIINNFRIRPTTHSSGSSLFLRDIIVEKHHGRHLASSTHAIFFASLTEKNKVVTVPQSAS